MHYILARIVRISTQPIIRQNNRTCWGLLTRMQALIYLGRDQLEHWALACEIPNSNKNAMNIAPFLKCHELTSHVGQAPLCWQRRNKSPILSSTCNGSLMILGYLWLSSMLEGSSIYTNKLITTSTTSTILIKSTTPSKNPIMIGQSQGTSVTRSRGLWGLPTHRHFTPSEGGVLLLSVALRKLRKATRRFAKWWPPSHKHSSSLFNCWWLYWIYTYCRVDIPKINIV